MLDSVGISDDATLSHAVECVRRSFRADRRFPEHVFQSNERASYACFSFSFAFSEGAGSLFRSISKLTGEKSVYVWSVDLFQTGLFYKNHAPLSPELVFTIDELENLYADAMFTWPPAGLEPGFETSSAALAYCADVMAWSGLSGRWHCWGERDNSLCVLRFDKNERFEELLKLQKYGKLELDLVEDAPRRIVAQEFDRAHQQEYKVFSETFKANYT